jgi:hypothetical protein
MKKLAHLILFLLSFPALFAQKPADSKDTEPFSFGVIDKIQSTELAELRTLNRLVVS